MTEDLDQSRDTLLRLSVPEAASRLGVTQSAIRKRVQRGQIPFEKDERGFTYVFIDGSHATGPETDSDGSRSRDGDGSRVTSHGVTGPGHDAATERLLRHLEEQNEWLRGELERKDAILLSLTQRIPELETSRDASLDERDGVESRHERSGRGAASEDAPRDSEPISKEQPFTEEAGQERRSWWHKLFGLQ